MAKGIYVDNQKVSKVYVDNTRVRRVYIDNNCVFNGREGYDVGLDMKSCKLTLGNGAHNPISGGSNGDWSIAFHFVWRSNQGGVLLYHAYNQRDSTIKLLSDGRIEVWAARYDTGNDKTWYSTKLCKVGQLNRVLITKQGRIFINGEDATPATFGGDMPFWGEVHLFPDRDIDGCCLGVTGWKWLLQPEHLFVTNLNYPHETDPTTFAMGFNHNLGFRLNELNGVLKSSSGTPSYQTYDIYWDWKALMTV